MSMLRLQSGYRHFCKCLCIFRLTFIIHSVGGVDPGTMGNERAVDNPGTIRNKPTIAIFEKMAKETAVHPM